jgi:hypothetical protein
LGDIQVVISDIDSTTTKSYTMGHLMTMIGKDWTHDGVAQLYTDISNNGYHYVFDKSSDCRVVVVVALFEVEDFPAELSSSAGL